MLSLTDAQQMVTSFIDLPSKIRFTFKIYFVLFLTVLGLCWCKSFSNCGEQGGLLSSWHGAWTHCGGIFVAKHGLQVLRLQQLQHMGCICGSLAPRAQAQQLWHTRLSCSEAWDLPGLVIEPMSPAWADGFFPTKPGKPLFYLLNKKFQLSQRTLKGKRQT